MENDIVTTIDKNDISAVENNPMIQVIERIAMSPDADIDKLEKMLAMQERIEATNAKKSFYMAMSGFQMEMPSVVKHKQGHNYQYAPLCDITKIAAPFLHKYGLSYRFEQQHDNKKITVTCVITHIDGHCEKTSMDGEPDTSGSKNAIQASGSAVQYLMRYTLIGALGITTADVDSDGRVNAQKTPEEQYQDYLSFHQDSIDAIRDGIDSGDLSTASEAWHELEQDVQGHLWKAKSKGGPFNASQRKVMQSSEFREANL